MDKFELTEVKEHENGDATYTFDLDEESVVAMAELGLKLVLYCSVCGVTTQQVFDTLIGGLEEQLEMSNPGDKDYEV